MHEEDQSATISLILYKDDQKDDIDYFCLFLPENEDDLTEPEEMALENIPSRKYRTK